MEQVIQSHVGAGSFMGTVLVARDGTVVLDKAYGMANLEWDVPNTPDTKFRLGSITKQFTAAAILLLEERGKLKVDDRIKTYLPDIADVVGAHHGLQPADAHVGDPQLHVACPSTTPRKAAPPPSTARWRRCATRCSISGPARK